MQGGLLTWYLKRDLNGRATIVRVRWEPCTESVHGVIWEPVGEYGVK